MKVRRVALIIKRKAVPAADPKDGYADPLVADAVKAQPVVSDIKKSIAHWERFPAPDARRQPCRFCGDNLIMRCRGEEHARCLNFHTAERRKQGAKA